LNLRSLTFHFFTLIHLNLRVLRVSIQRDVEYGAFLEILV
jgi:hypothetical protein